MDRNVALLRALIEDKQHISDNNGIMLLHAYEDCLESNMKLDGLGICCF